MELSYLLYLLVILLFSVISVNAGKDYYKVLGITRKASPADIKKAYRKLSLKYHPDKNSAPDASDKFAELSIAYDTLSDPEKRKIYNAGGEDAVKQQEQRGNAPEAHDPFSIFEAFGFGNMGGGRRQQQEQRTPNVEIPVRVTLKQLYNGEILDVNYLRQVLCVEASSCTKPSNSCQGPGISMRTQQLAPGFVQQVQVHDTSCISRGKMWKPNCKACPKGPTEEEEIQVTLDIHKGHKDGDRITFEQVADEAPGHIAGDLIFILKQIHDKSFERKGNDLWMSYSITLQEALVGFSRQFTHLDGHKVDIVMNDVVSCGQVHTIRGEGMPVKGANKRFGDLFITFEVQFPKRLSDTQKAFVKQALVSSNM